MDPRDIGSLCPYLVSEDGAWRTTHPTRDHRCAAVHPPGVLALDRQRDLCLGPTHHACPAFLAVRAAGAPPPAVPTDALEANAPVDLWPVTRTTPVLLESPGFHLGSLPGLAGRPGGQAILGILMVLAFVAVVVARTVDPGTSASPSPSRSASPSTVASPSPTPTPAPTVPPSVDPSASAPASAPASVVPSASAPASVVPSAPASAAVGASPGASGEVAGVRVYRVRSGDTLSAIAAEFGTTVPALMAANGITDASLLRIGQRLTIP